MKLLFVFLIVTLSNVLYSADQLQRKEIDPQVEQTVRELLKQEGVDSNLEIYDAGSIPSFAGVSFNISGKLAMLINQEKFNTLSLQEQQRVILHEIGHIKRGVYRFFLCTSGPVITVATVMVGTVILAKSSDSNPMIAIAAGCLTELISLIAFAALARHEEFAADAYALNVDPNVEVMRSLLEKRKKLFEKNSSWWSRLFDDHPTSEERIAHIQLLAQKFNLANT